MSPDMNKNLQVICDQIDKKYGKGTVMSFTDKAPYNPDDVTSSGSIGLDMALGIGGYKKGRLVEIYGPESSGKTTLCLHAIHETQKQDQKCLFIDAEHALDITYAKALGVNVDELLISQPDYGEQALEIVDMFVRSKEVGLIVVDSVAALIPKKELEGDIGDHHIGSQARMMSQAMRKIAGVTHKTGCTVIFVNQIRMKIGVMFGSPETTTGGNALKFYASQRLDIRRIGSVTQSNDVTGNRTRVKIVKNKLAPPFKQVEFDIKFGIGIDKNQELLDLAVMDKIVEKKGAGWYKYKGETVAQGAKNATDWLNSNQEIKEDILKEIRENRGIDLPEQNEEESNEGQN
jgi:recombination protein RecA